MTAVLLCGRFPVLFEGRGGVRCMDVVRADLDTLVRQVAEDLAQHKDVLALVPDWASPETGRRLGLVRQALETTRLVSVSVSLPPLALAVLAAQLGAVAERLPAPGPLVPGAGWLAQRLVVAAWSSTTGGRRVGTAGWIRLLSLVPRARFAITVQPAPGARWLPCPPGVLEPWLIDGPSALVVSGRERDLGWIRDEVGHALEPAMTVEHEPVPDARWWWGARRLVEIVHCPADADEIVRELAKRFPCRACVWCGEDVAEPSCPFCRMTRSSDHELEVVSP